MLRFPTVLALGFLLTACPEANPPEGPPPGAGLNATCAPTIACRAGLSCDATTSTCQGNRSTPNGSPCTLGVECESGLCAPSDSRGVCFMSGARAQGSACEGDSDCAPGLKCGYDGNNVFPECLPAGVKDLGAACTLGLECAQGLQCSNGACALIGLSASMYPHGYPPSAPTTPGSRWAGAKCPTPKPAAQTALFVLPRDTDDAAGREDFYRLPFPNDALRDSAGLVDFSRHPREPQPVFGFDLVGRTLEALRPEPFSNAPTVLFRFDGPIDFTSLVLNGANANVKLINLAPTQGTPRGLNLLSGAAGNRYVCSNWVGVRPFDGDSLEAGTWAVVLLKGITGTGGAEVVPSPDLSALLQTTAPLDERQALAWPAYAPLRAWLAAQGLPSTQVLNAAVFTVGNPRRLLERLESTVAALGVPQAEAWVKCGATPAPTCACSGNDTHDEWTTRVTLPVFQQGTAPYRAVSQGGGIDTASPTLSAVRMEAVCATLTVPRGAAPAGGWPVVLFAHDTDGSHLAHAARPLTGLQAAVLGFEQVGHGARAGSGVLPAQVLFNLGNPASARGTWAQGAADWMSVTQWVRSWTTTAPAGLPPLDVQHLALWGHGTGATAASLFLAGDRSVDGALMTGLSASYAHGLINRTRPVDSANGLATALGEPNTSSVTLFHPVVGLLQAWNDVVDPLHVARRDVLVPALGANQAFARHVFQVWGKDDAGAPRSAQASFTRAARLAFVGPQVDVFDATVLNSVSANVTMPRNVTAAMRQYTTDGYDGRDVVFRNASATLDASRFLSRVVRGEVPTLPEP